MPETNWSKNEPERPGKAKITQRQSSWQQAKLYSDLLQLQKREPFTALVSKQQDPKFEHSFYSITGPDSKTSTLYEG